MGNEESSPVVPAGPPAPQPPPPVRKVLVVGGPGVGKTALLRHRLHKVPLASPYEASMAPEMSLLTTTRASVHLWDVPSAEASSGRTPIFYTHAHCIVVVADALRPSSFDDAAKWKRDVDMRNLAVPCALLVTKSAPPAHVAAFAAHHGFSLTLAAGDADWMPRLVRWVVEETAVP